MRKNIQTDHAPAAIGPYSQGFIANGFLFTSGQLGMNPETNEMISDEVTEQAKQSMENVRAILEEAGYGLGDIIKTTIYLDDMQDFPVVNEIYASFFSGTFPSRSCVAVEKLPKDGKVEIEAIAYKETTVKGI